MKTTNDVLRSRKDFLESNTFAKSKRKVGAFSDDDEESEEDLQQDEKR